MPNAWDRQRDADGELEPALWFGRFDKLYRPQGPERSLLGAYNAWRQGRARNSKKAASPAGSWITNADKWRWKDRAEAWDEHERQRRLRIEADALEAMYRRHVNLATAMQTVAGKRIHALAQDDENPTLSPSDARQYAKDGIEIERTARGLPREFVQILGMSDDELVAYYRERYTTPPADGSGDDAARDSDTDDA